MVTADIRMTSTDRANMKRAIYTRDGGRCCLCKKVVSLHGSNLDHRVGLQFGGSHDESNQWTLCIPCHVDKTNRERRLNEPDAVSLAVPMPSGKALDAGRFNMV